MALHDEFAHCSMHALRKRNSRKRSQARQIYLQQKPVTEKEVGGGDETKGLQVVPESAEEDEDQDEDGSQSSLWQRLQKRKPAPTATRQLGRAWQRPQRHTVASSQITKYHSSNFRQFLRGLDHRRETPLRASGGRIDFREHSGRGYYVIPQILKANIQDFFATFHILNISTYLAIYFKIVQNLTRNSR